MGAQATTTTGRVEKRSMERIKFTAWSGAIWSPVVPWNQTFLCHQNLVIYGKIIWVILMGNINGYEIWLMMVNNYLVGGWALALWKMMELWVSSSIFWSWNSQWKKIGHVPKHQAENSCLLHWTATTKTGRSYWKSSIEIRDLWMFIWPEKPPKSQQKVGLCATGISSGSSF